MSLDWNEFNRELQNRVSDPGLRYILGMIYERLLDTTKQVDTCGTVMLEMANTMQNFMSLNEVFDGRLRELKKHMDGTVDGVSLSSVPLTNDDLDS